MIYAVRSGWRVGVSAFMAMVFALTATGCSLNFTGEVGEDVAARYTPPETYSDHRAQQQFFTIDGRRIAYTDHGPRNGEAIVLLHGVPTSSWMYRKLIPLLQDDFRIVTIDFLGFGSSDKAKKAHDLYQTEKRAERVTALLDELEINQFSLLMHDMGGLVAWEVTRLIPTRIDRMIVLNTIVNQQGFNHPNIDAGAFTRQMMKAYSSPVTSVAVLTKTFNDLGLVGDYELSEEECFGYVAPIREGADNALYAFFTSINETLFARLEENRTLFPETFRGDTLVLWGRKDDVLTSAQTPILKEMLNIPDDQIHIFDDHAHFLAEEAPTLLGRHIREFMSDGKSR